MILYTIVITILLASLVPQGGITFAGAFLVIPPHYSNGQRHHHILCMSSSDEYDGMSGLTDDGDFAIYGVNASEEEDDDNSILSSNFNTGTSIGSQLVGNMLFNEDILKSGRGDLLGASGVGKKYKDFRGNEIVPKIDPAVKNWLFEVLPSLDEDDGQIYAEGLTNIGFHPECQSLCEVMYEDLNFITKVLHRRYLFKEITGQQHPFEP